jgi:carbonic anhydrase
MDISVDSLNFQDYDLPLIGSLVNNGHSIQFNPDNSSTQIMSGGALPAGETYQFAQLHFHWGNKPNKGSEHTVDGIQYDFLF